MLILITQLLRNLICYMTKAMNGQNFSENFSNPFLHLSILFAKPCFNYCLFSILLLPFFILNFKNFFWPHASCDCKAYELTKYKHSKLVRIKPDETRDAINYNSQE